MALTGFSKSCAKRSGGVRSIYLIEADKIAQATYNSATDAYTAVTPVSGAVFKKYEFLEDAASLTETLNMAQGSYSVEHRVAFSLGKFDAASRRAVEELTTASYGGLVAIVTTTCNDSFLVGYSSEFAAERPLRVAAGSGETGSKLKDGTRHSIVLVSEDSSLARAFTGTVTTE